MPKNAVPAKDPSRGRVSPLRFAPLTAERWPDLERLFGPNGACGGCWCMWWKRTREEFERTKGEPNKRALKREVARGEVPGLLAYRGDEPIGWCAVQPRSAYPMLARSRPLAPVDDAPVWSVTCFFIKAGHRRTGLSQALLEAAKTFVDERGGRLLEGYPKDKPPATTGANSLWMGLASVFRAAGFKEIARRAPTRPIMRIQVVPQKRPK